MAVDDSSNPPLSQPQPSLPDYSQMIMAAIEGLNEKEGSNKSTISDYIELNFSDLPPNHSTLLSNHLEKMKISGQLVFINNNYLLKPDDDTDAPPKRGRGRPPKPKVSPPPGAVLGPPRPRGRPPKPRDPLAPPSQPKKAASSGRPRGRPRKIHHEGVVPPAAATAAEVSGVKRGRGRPRKA